MRFRIVIEATAIEDLEAINLWLSRHSGSAASAWYAQMAQEAGSLDTAPQRCPFAPENNSFEEEIRHLLFGKRRNVYRVIFTLRGTSVHVLHVRDGAQQPLEPPC